MSKHTPGPWRFKGEYTGAVWAMENGREVTVAATFSEDWYWPSENVVANARLIAAAPELLAACEQVLRAIGDAEPDILDDMYGVKMQLHKAIAKAKGE